MGRIWKGDAEGKCSDVCNQGDVMPANNQLLLKGQTLIGLDGKLMKAKAVSGKTGHHYTVFKVGVFVGVVFGFFLLLLFFFSPL